jgi:uncharacterized protein YkwD
MRVRQLLGRRTAAIAVMGIVVGLGLSACTPPDTSAAPPTDPFQASLFSELNNSRAQNGLPPLVWGPKLANTAGTWANQMSNAGSLYHQSLSDLINSPDYANYSTLGENILVGPGNMNAQAIEAAWMASSPHRANITSRSFNVVGIGYFRGPDGRLWVVQDFGGV